MIEIGKVYRTRDGREVRIYAVDGYGRYPVHAAYAHEDGGWYASQWTIDGVFEETVSANQVLDLIEVKPKITREYWMVHLVGFCTDTNGIPMPTKERAELVAKGRREGRHKPGESGYAIAITGPHTVEFIEGEGLLP